MKFKNYLNEGRSKGVSHKEAYDLLTKNCMQSVRKWFDGHKIFRATESKNDFLFFDGGIEPRISRNTLNYYTLVINNHPSWKKFPKRELICSGGSGARALAHGAGRTNKYQVFPYDGAKIGICSEDDIWQSFKNIQKAGFIDASEFNEWLYDKFNLPDDTWIGFIEETDTIEFVSKYGDTLYDYIIGMLDPKQNGFKLQTISRYNVKQEENVEVWTDSKCVLIGMGVVNSMMKWIEENLNL